VARARSIRARAACRGFGAVLFARAEQETSDIADESSNAETVHLAVIAMVLSTLVSGWIVPLGPERVEQEFSRFRDSTAAPEPADERPERLKLDELILRMNSVPGAGQELLRRFMWIAASFFTPLLAGVLVRLKSRWTQGEAAAATLALFIFTFQLVFGSAL
jgi:hypothetical protein